MAVETADDRSFLLADFGVTATWSGGSFIGIFDNDYVDAEVGGSVSFAVSQPRFTCRTADLTGMTEDTALTIEGISYVVRVFMNDGTGMSVLVLEAQ